MKTYKLIIALAATALMAACGTNPKMNLTYEHAERYSVGDAVIEQPVGDIDIDWYGGEVTLRRGERFRVSEESDSTLSDSLRLRYYVDKDSVLNIRYAQSGSYRHEQLLNLNKRLVVEVPMDAAIDEIDIDMVSGMLNLDSVQCRELSIDGVNVTAHVWTHVLPDKIDFDGVNATLRLYVPPTAGMTVEIDGVNTELRSTLPVGKEDKKTHVVGDGRCKVDVDAVNGTVYIDGIDENGVIKQ